MINIYVLKLEQDKYYIGKSNNSNIRIEQHFLQNGSVWTKKYKPLEIIEILNNSDDFDENKYTLKYMELYGINNVRGSSFCNIILSKQDIDTITKMIDCAMNKCYICGSNNHFVANCTNDIKINKKEDKQCTCSSSFFKKHRKSKCLLNNTINKITELFDNEDDNIDELKIKLISKQKFNNITKEDIILDNIIDITHKLLNINIIHNTINITQNLDVINDNKTKITKCNKCNRTGHISENCYAKTILINSFYCRYCNKKFETQKGATFHENIHCKLKK